MIHLISYYAGFVGWAALCIATRRLNEIGTWADVYAGWEQN